MDQGGGAWPSNAPRRAYATLVCLLAGVLLLVPGLSHASREAWSKTLKKAQHNPAQLIRDAGQALLNSEKIGDKQGELLALQRLSAGNRFLFHAAALKKNAERGIALARELGESEALCWFLHNKALSMLYDRRPDETDALLAEANKLFNEAIAVAEARNLAACVPWIHVSQGMALTRFRKSADALESISKAYALFEALRDDFGMASALTGMASIRREHREGLIYLERALDLTDPNIYQILAAENYLIRGHWYYARRDMPRARQFYDRAATTARAVQYSTQLGLAESSFAKIAKYEQRFADALVHVDRALLLVKSHPDMGHYINSLLLRADVLMRLGKQQEALHSLSDADTKLKTIDDPLSESMFHELAAAMHAGLGAYQEAYLHLRSMNGANEKLETMRNRTMADELAVRFNVQLKEAENALLRTKQDEAEKALLRVKQDEAESRKIVLLLSLLLIGGVALYLRKRASADRAEAAYHKARAAAESAANQAKSAFLANISHELRSPLNAILGFTRLVARESGLSDAARNDLRIVLKSSEHLYSLINQVLELSKIEAGHVVLNESTVDLYGLLEELEEMFSLSAQQKGLQFLVDSGSGLPRYIRTDAGKLRQVLINLLNNAIKFTGGGEVALRARTSPEGGRLHFAINDTGPGISADEIGKLGEVFVQAAAGRLAKEGTGLGLSITRRFVKLMGGQLRISSELGHGATFAFDIALDEISEASVVPEVDTASRKVIALTPGQPRYRILAVDDREEGRQLLTRLLAPLDFEVREASNGQEAVEIWEKWEPHLICMDIRMPVMDGREATRRIKATEKGKATVIVALTASSFDEERESILADGCDDFVRKPFHEHVLFDTLRKRLGVEFVYEDDMDRSTAALSDAARLAVLPVALRRRLATSLAGLDVAAIAGAIAAIREHDGGLADALDAQTANFDYAHLRALLAVADR